MDILLKSVADINLSNRARNSLQWSKINTVSQLLELNEEQMKKMPGIGTGTLKEILAKCDEIRHLTDDEYQKKLTGIHSSLDSAFSDFDTWFTDEQNRNIFIDCVKSQRISIDEIPHLNVRVLNILRLNRIEFVYQLCQMSVVEISQLKQVDDYTCSQLISGRHEWLMANKDKILDYIKSISSQNEADGMTGELQHETPADMTDQFPFVDFPEAVQRFVENNDVELEKFELSVRAYNCLTRTGYHLLSEIVFLTENELYRIPNMGKRSIEEILSKRQQYLSDNAKRIKQYCEGNEYVLWTEQKIRERILELYKVNGFRGYSLNEFTEALKLPEEISVDQLKNCIGKLLADGKLEYVDYRCYRVYPRFIDYVSDQKEIEDRNRDIVVRRLHGETLEQIGQTYNLTRERVRQLANKAIKNFRDLYQKETDVQWFDEDYYAYFYETYLFDKEEVCEWLSVTPSVWDYLDMSGIKQGKKKIDEALDDSQLDVGLKLKIKNYINRNKIYIDGIWVEKNHRSLEKVLVRKFCQDEMSFTDFISKYNEYLYQQEIPFDESIYYTEEITGSRNNHLSDCRYLLWKMNEKLRYYDIDGRDYTELLAAINIEFYENTEISTLKWMEDYPEVMAKYDIRDQYELHNLLRKIVNKEDCHDIQFPRMPDICFGTFDRNAAILDLLVDNAPISQQDLCRLLHEEYGYNEQTVLGTYLKPFAAYYYQGIYSIDQKVMSLQNRIQLQDALTDDFYFMDEIRDIYKGLVQNADPEEVNAYNLIQMGFTVYCKYALRNYPTLASYFEDILTRNELTDITEMRTRYSGIQVYYQTLSELKKKLTVIEYAPDKLISASRLERNGITLNRLYDFCDSVYDYVKDGEYFSIQSLKQDGFTSELFDEGLTDWCYANILVSDSRFSSGIMYGNLVFYKGNKDIMIKSFQSDIIASYGSIDVYDLANILVERYGCTFEDKYNMREWIINKNEPEVYYDKILDRLYTNAELYYREIEEMGGND